MEGFEPSSKRGTNVLSTCVFPNWFSCVGRHGTANRRLSPLNFGRRAGRLVSYSRYSCTAGSVSLGKWATGRCLVSATIAEIKLIYCTSIRQRERSCFRHLKLLMSLIKERSHHCSARLHTTSTRCQNRSSPMLWRKHGCASLCNLQIYAQNMSDASGLSIFNLKDLGAMTICC